MENMMDMLLSTNIDDLARPKVEKEIGRLSKAVGSPFILELEALTVEEFSDIQKSAVRIGKNAKFEDVDTDAVQILSIIKATKNVNFADAALRERLEAHSSKAVVQKLFLPGEIAQVYNAIADISGFGDEAVRDVKNV
ncbi:phage tail assembly chaperone [Fusibacter sp. JL216-2]|uniref:phage tail assembly chaperone n=1 Tax=Fusibacter sp. JL216-2 TaxID=3071453 RepID=UPI003D35436D